MVEVKSRSRDCVATPGYPALEVLSCLPVQKLSIQIPAKHRTRFVISAFRKLATDNVRGVGRGAARVSTASFSQRRLYEPVDSMQLNIS